MEGALAKTNESMTTRSVGADLYARFVAYVDASPRTVQTYATSLRQFMTWLAEEGIQQPTRDDVLAYRDHLVSEGMKPTTVAAYLGAVRRFFGWTQAEGLYPDVAQGIKAPKVSKANKRDALTAQQVRDMLATCDRSTPKGRRDYAMLCLQSCCGLRDVEVVNANVGDLRTRGGVTVLYVLGKGRSDKSDYVKVPDQVERAIRESLSDRGRLADEAPLFVSMSGNSYGKRLTTRSVSGNVKTHLRAAGMDSDRLSAHSLRHTACTLALIAGNDVREVQQMARHASVNTTLIYAHDLDRLQSTCETDVARMVFA